MDPVLVSNVGGTLVAPLPDAPSRPIDAFTAVVPAGGAGTRLWPLSRSAAPKFLHDLTGTGRSLLQSTWDRLVPLAGTGNVMIVTGAAHAPAVTEQLPDLPPSNLLAEPSPRDSMAAIGLAAAVLAHRQGPSAVLGSFAADHLIPPASLGAFDEAVRAAVVAAQAGLVVTIGIAPTFPSTGFGYVRAGEALGLSQAPLVARAVEFVEKPDQATAVQYLHAGSYRWNAGMFVVTCGVLLDHVQAQLPELAAGVRELGAVWDTAERDEALTAIWPRLTKIAIDHAIAEPVTAAGGVAVVPGSFAWDDIGDWSALADLLPQAAGLAVLGRREDVQARDAGGIVVAGSGRAVTVVGIDDAVVVDTPDAVLVTTRAHAQEVKGVVEAWRAAGRGDLL